MLNKDNFNKLTEYYRGVFNNLHEHPEPSGEEVWTTEFILGECKRIGLEILPLRMQTGVLARLRGCGAKAVALRADIDAVTLEYPLRRPFGKAAHTCGHDGHTAALLMAAEMLCSLPESARKNDIYFIFQPAEETMQGAAQMLNFGLRTAFDKPLTAIYGIHNRPEVPAGDIVAEVGARMAAKCDFAITVLGVGGHGGEPHLCRDPIIASAALINSAQTIVSRSTAPQDACVVSVCSIHGGSEKNFAPTGVELTGSIRGLSDEVVSAAYARLMELAENTAAMYGCTARMQRTAYSPVTNCSPALYKNARAAAEAVFADIGGGFASPAPAMGGDDFALLAELAPTFYYWVGSGKADGTSVPWHDRAFEADPGFLPAAALLYAYSALGTEEGRSMR